MLKQLALLTLAFTVSVSASAFDLKATTKKANQGNLEAQIALTNYYKNQRDFQNEFVWTTRLANQGLASAQFNLGLIYANGQGVVKNYRLAKIWFDKACDHQLQQACANAKTLAEAGF